MASETPLNFYIFNELLMLNSCVLIKGVPKSYRIERLWRKNEYFYCVQFLSSSTIYTYRVNDVVILSDAVWHDPIHCKVSVRGKLIHNLKSIYTFSSECVVCWRLVYVNGFFTDYLDKNISVVESCLSKAEAMSVFEYYKRIAGLNDLCKDSEGKGLLTKLYNQLSFIDPSLPIASFLSPNDYYPRTFTNSQLIFPFGCNESQQTAVVSAFTNQISVIQGPPGTGKTQTILNLIANIVFQGKTVLVVSNNNSATDNVLKKLVSYGFGFIVAPLGNRSNKEIFIENQTELPEDIKSWSLSLQKINVCVSQIKSSLQKLKICWGLQEKLSKLKQELIDVSTEYRHFVSDSQCNTNINEYKLNSSKKIIRLWKYYQTIIDNDQTKHNKWLYHLIQAIRWVILEFVRKNIYGIMSVYSRTDIAGLIAELQSLFYQYKIIELNQSIDLISRQLADNDMQGRIKDLTGLSLLLFKDKLSEKYAKSERFYFKNTTELKSNSELVLNQYPVVLSTTFSAKTSLREDVIFDYVIMDEASQVSSETGVVALSCAKNAVIVGDNLQLPNVVTGEDKIKMEAIFRDYQIDDNYNCAVNSFLKAITLVIPNISQTLLREHYRCHPKIINFCNQKFYNGQLLIMTEDKGENDVMSVILTNPGHHCRDLYNQREIDVIKREVCPSLCNSETIGIISPYNHQVDELNKQIKSIEAATIHKYQGREMDSIIFTSVDDVFSEFSNDSNLLNVAVSRAKKHFYLVCSGNIQDNHGNISDLIDYITYNNCSVTQSKLCSIFDYLYGQYSSEVTLNKGRISEYDSENLMYALLNKMISSNHEWRELRIICHYPVKYIIRDDMLLSKEEKQYISHISTHVDFLLYNQLSKTPILAIEVDGYSYHNVKTKQYNRDLMKNHIFELYELPLLRLSTVGCNEEEKISNVLKSIY